MALTQHRKVLGASIVVMMVGTAGVVAQSIDSARVRTALDATRALRGKYEQQLGHVAKVNGIALHYLEWGNPGGVPLVWSHGSASTGYEIRSVAPRLVEGGYRVIAPDYRGHGQTRVTDYDFSIYHIADDLVALLDQLGIKRAVFGGASKGGFVAAAVYDRYPDRVLGLLMADGGTWSNQWIFDHHGTDMVKRQLGRGDGPPAVTGRSEEEVFFGLLGGRITAAPSAPPAEALLDQLVRIGPDTGGRWAFLPGFDRMMGSLERYYAGATRPSTMPLLQWSQHALIPMIVFRDLRVPMMILDPQEAGDELPVTDQNELLAARYPKLVVHQVYPDSRHNVIGHRPDWFIRDAVALLRMLR